MLIGQLTAENVPFGHNAGISCLIAIECPLAWKCFNVARVFVDDPVPGQQSMNLLPGLNYFATRTALNYAPLAFQPDWL